MRVLNPTNPVNLDHPIVVRYFHENQENSIGASATLRVIMPKITLDKTAGTPENAFIDNGDITKKKVDNRLDRNWYLELAEKRIKEFVS